MPDPYGKRVDHDRAEVTDATELEDAEVSERAPDATAGADDVRAGAVLAPGDRIAGRYRLIRSLGAGGQGHTYLVEDEQSGEEVALKRFDLRAATDWKRVELFERECKVLRSIRHPAVPRYLDQFEHDGAYYLVMERVQGESLQERRQRGVLLSEAEVWRLLHEVGAILDELHAMQPPIIHRDVKPHNLVRRPDGTMALVDFGAVRDMLMARGGSTVAGTFGYMAPEQLHGRALPQTDVYGLGATVVALMTGREPEELEHKGLRIDLAKELRASAALIAVLQRMLEPDPDARPSTVRAAMGPYAPSEAPHATSAAHRERSPRASSSPGAHAPQEALEQVASQLPAPLALAFSLAVFVVGLPFFALGVVVFPLLGELLPGIAGAAARGAARWASGIHQSMLRTSGRAGRAALQGADDRRKNRVRERVQERARARELRNRQREEAAVRREQAKAERRAGRQRAGRRGRGG